jgi:phage anti-repressor protein
MSYGYGGDVRLPTIREIDGKPMVDARSLHRGLGEQTRFQVWLARKTECFIGGIDFKPDVTDGVAGVNFWFSIPMARQICLSVTTDSSRAIRNHLYDIDVDCRTRLKTSAEILMLQKAADVEDEVNGLKLELRRKDDLIARIQRLITEYYGPGSYSMPSP